MGFWASAPTLLKMIVAIDVAGLPHTNASDFAFVSQNIVSSSSLITRNDENASLPFFVTLDMFTSYLALANTTDD